MAVNLPFREWVEFSLRSLYLNDGTIAMPNKNSFYGILCNGGANDTSTKASVFGSEITEYSRVNVEAQATSYDAIDKRWEIPSLIWNLTPTESIQFNTAVLIAAGRGENSKPISSISLGNPATFSTATVHGLALNEEVMITSDANSLPSPLTAQIYYVKNIVSAAQFQISATIGGSAIALTNAGLNLRLRYAKGRLVAFREEDSLQTLPAGAPTSWEFNIANSAYFGVGQGS